MDQFGILRHCGGCCPEKIKSGSGKTRREADAADRGWLILCCGAVLCSGAWSAASGLHPVGASSGPPLTFQVVTAKHVFRHFQMSPGVVESSPAESHCHRPRGNAVLEWCEVEALRLRTCSGRRRFNQLTWGSGLRGEAFYAPSLPGSSGKIFLHIFLKL